LKRKAPRRFARHIQNDPQECGALRQGNIALIHSAPTGEKEIPSAKFVMPAQKLAGERRRPSDGYARP
jgi:hypothetical protein